MHISSPFHVELVHRLKPYCCRALFAALLLTGSACHNRYERGLDAIAEQRFEDARADARIGKQESPEDPRYDLLMAQALVKEAESMSQEMASDTNQPPMALKKVQQRYKKAIPYAQAALDSGQLNAEAGRLLGKIYWELDNPIETARVWRIAREADPESIQNGDYLKALRAALGRVVFFKDHVKSLELRHELEDFVETHPDFMAQLPPEVSQNVGENLSRESFRKNREAVAEQYADNGDHEKALTLYSQLIEDFPEESRYHYKKGSLLLLTGQAEEATDSFEIYAKHHDSHEHGQRLRDVAQLAESYGVRSVSLTFYTKLLEQLDGQPSTERANVYLKLIELRFALADDEEARKLIKAYLAEVQTLEKGEIPSNKYLTLSAKASQFDRAELAIELLEEAQKQAEADLKITERLAEYYAQKAEFGNVERVLKQYVDRVREQSPDKHIEALRQVANWSKRRQNYTLAQYFYERILELDENNPRTLLELAEIQTSQNKIDEIRITLERYIKASRREDPALNDAARIYRRLRMFKEAEELYKELIKKEPAKLVYANNLADLYSEWGKVELIPTSYMAYLKARDRDPGDLLAIARRLRQFGYAEQAIPYLQEAADKGNNVAWLMLADVYSTKSRTAELKRALQKYVENAPNREQALSEVLSRYTHANLINESVATLEELITFPNDRLRTNYRERLTEYYLQQGRRSDAFNLWKKVLTEADNPSSILNSMHYKFTRSGEFEWLLALYQNLLEEGIGGAEIYRYTGDLFYKMSNSSNTNVANSQRDDLIRKAEVAYTAYLEKGNLSQQDLASFASERLRENFVSLAQASYEQHIASLEKDNKSVPPATLLDYGTILLKIKEYDEAIVILRRYVSESGNTYSAQMRAGEEFNQHGLLEEAEPYLREAFTNAIQNNRKSLFENLFDIYSKSNQNKKLARLINDYIDATPSVSEARATILSKAESYGQRDIMLEQLEQLARSTDGTKRYSLGILYWQLDQPDKARRVWDEWLDTASTEDAADHHAELAAFYQAHNLPDDAFGHWTKAIAKAKPERASYYKIQRAKLYIAQGLVQEGMQDFEAAYEELENQKNYTLEQKLYERVQTLLEAGQFRAAYQAAGQSLKYPGISHEYYHELRARFDLAGGDVARADRIIQELQSSSVRFDVIVSLLMSNGFVDQAITLLEQEIQSGDYIQAGALIVNAYLQNIIDSRGVDAVERLLQPLLDRPRPDRTLEYRLGMALIEHGFPERGVTYLRTVLDSSAAQGVRGMGAINPVVLTLIHAYIALGEVETANQLLLEELSKQSLDGQRQLLEYLIPAYLMNGHEEDLHALLSHMTQSEQLTSAALPYLITLLCQNGEALDAITILRAMTTQKEAREKGSLYQTQLFEIDLTSLNAQTAFLHGVTALGKAGYFHEALDLLSSAPASIKLDPGFHALKAHLMLASGDEAMDDIFELVVKSYATSTQDLMQAEEETLTEGESSQNDGPSQRATMEAQARLSMARQLFFIGRTERIDELVRPLLTSKDEQHASQALAILLGLHRVGAASGTPQTLVETYLTARYNDYEAKLNAASQLFAQGFDDLANQLMQEHASSFLTQDNQYNIISFAAETGDAKLFAQAIDTFWRIHPDPIPLMERFLEIFAMSHSVDFLAPIFDKLDQDQPPLKRSALRAELLLKEGRTTEARELLLSQIKASNFDSDVIDHHFYYLSTRRHSTEVAKALAPQIPEESISPLSHLYIGLGLADLDMHDEAKPHLDNYLRSSPEQGISATEIARQLIRRDQYALAREYAQIAVQRSPDTPIASLWRGVTSLLDGDVKSAKHDIDRALEQGLAPQDALPTVLKLALDRNAMELATYYTQKLLNHSTLLPPGKSDVIIGMTFSIWNDAKHGAELLKLIESDYTSMLTYYPLLHSQTQNSIAGLYEQAGYPEQTFKKHEQRIQHDAISTSFQRGSTPTTLNNFAYARSTSEIGLDEAKEMSLRSIAMAGARSASYLDTLGWIAFKQGDIKTARYWIDKAVYSMPFEQGSSRELYEHIAELQARMGQDERAVWTTIYLEHLERDDSLPAPSHVFGRF